MLHVVTSTPAAGEQLPPGPPGGGSSGLECHTAHHGRLHPSMPITARPTPGMRQDGDRARISPLALLGQTALPRAFRRLTATNCQRPAHR